MRYFNCWIEDPVKQVGNNDDDTESTQTASSSAAVDEISDPFAPPDPKDPFAYNAAENSKSLSFPPVRFSLAAKRFDEVTSSDEDDGDSETEDEEEEDSGDETESEHPLARSKHPEPPVAHASIMTDTTNSDPATFRTLYIAMEFVDNVSSSLSVQPSFCSNGRRGHCGNSSIVVCRWTRLGGCLRRSSMPCPTCTRRKSYTGISNHQISSSVSSTVVPTILAAYALTDAERRAIVADFGLSVSRRNE